MAALHQTRVKSADWSSPSPRKPKAKDRGFLLKSRMLQLGCMPRSKYTKKGVINAFKKSFGPDPEIEEWYKEATFNKNKDGNAYFEVSITNTMYRRLQLFRGEIIDKKRQPLKYWGKEISIVCNLTLCLLFMSRDCPLF